MKKSRNEKAPTTPPAQEEQDEFETRNLLPTYRSPRRTEAPPVTILATGHVTLVEPKKPKDMKVLQNIMPQQVNLSFQDSNTSGISELDRKNYMTLF